MMTWFITNGQRTIAVRAWNVQTAFEYAELDFGYFTETWLVI